MPRIVLNKLSDFAEADYGVHVYCPRCTHHARLDVAALLVAQGDMTLGRLQGRLRCTGCGARDVQLSLNHAGFSEPQN